MVAGCCGPMARGGCGSRHSTAAAAAAQPRPHEQVERFGWRFAPRQVMQVANDYEKEGIQRPMWARGNNRWPCQRTLTVRFSSGESRSSDGREVDLMGWGELDTTWRGAYACRSSRGPGQRIPRCGHPPAQPSNYAMLQRNLVYTGHHRGKQLVVLVGRGKPWRWR